jgi:hypothetical protein
LNQGSPIAMASEVVSLDAVRQHLQQMGFHAVPDEVIHDLRSELLARISGLTLGKQPRVRMLKLQQLLSTTSCLHYSLQQLIFD